MFKFYTTVSEMSFWGIYPEYPYLGHWVSENLKDYERERRSLAICSLVHGQSVYLVLAGIIKRPTCLI